jgi:hypothetical protein
VKVAAVKIACALALFPVVALAQARTESRELVGQVGSRSAYLTVQGSQGEDGGWQLSGEYVLLPTLTRRFFEGERGPQLGATSLREGTTPILFGRDATGELRGVWRDGVFRGIRYGAGGQERERFEFSEKFPSMQAYSAEVRCQADAATLAYSVENGEIRSFEWRTPGCVLSGLGQQPMQDGLRLASGRCAVTMRDVGETVRVAAGNCDPQCAAIEPLFVDRRGSCRAVRPEAR